MIARERLRLAEQRAAEDMPTPMTAGHLRRARLFVLAYGAFGSLVILFTAVTASANDPAQQFSLIGITWFTVALQFGIALVGAAKGKWDSWSTPLKVLQPDEAHRALQVMFRHEAPPTDLKVLIRLLGERFFFGSTYRLATATTSALIMIELAFLADMPGVLRVLFVGTAAVFAYLCSREVKCRRMVRSRKL